MRLRGTFGIGIGPSVREQIPNSLFYQVPFKTSNAPSGYAAAPFDHSSKPVYSDVKSHFVPKRSYAQESMQRIADFYCGTRGQVLLWGGNWKRRVRIDGQFSQ